MFCDAEFFNFRETSDSLESKKGVGLVPLTHGMFGYSLTKPSQNSPFISKLLASCRESQIEIESFHTETGILSLS